MNRLRFSSCSRLSLSRHRKPQPESARLLSRYAEVIAPSVPLETARHEKARPVIATIALTAFLGSQCVLPSAFMLQDAHAVEKARQPKVLPRPSWVQARDKKEAKLRAAADARLAKGEAARQPGGAIGFTRRLLAQMEGRPEAPASKPGQVKASQPTGCKDCEVTMKALDLRRVPTEKELRMAGQLGGALTPIGNADVDNLANRMDEELKKAGVAAGLRAPAAVQTPAGRLVAERQAKIRRLQAINMSFGRAIQDWNKHNYSKAAGMFKEHLEEFPDSPWAGEALLHLGCDSKYNGRFTEAEETFENLLETTSGDPGSPSREIHQKSKLRWADLDIATGRWDDASSKLSNIIQSDSDWRRRTWARYWLQTTSLMKKNARNLQACGSQSLSTLFASLDKQKDSEEVSELIPPGKGGFSLEELSRIARKHEVSLRGFKANKPEQLATLPLPLIVHYDFSVRQKTAIKSANLANVSTSVAPVGKKAQRYALPKAFIGKEKSGHFLVVQKVDATRRIVHIYDPLEKRPYQLSYRELAHEWSGKGLVLDSATTAKRLALNGLTLTKSEMALTRGGCCGIPSAEDNDCGNNAGGTGGCLPGGTGTGSGGCGPEKEENEWDWLDMLDGAGKPRYYGSPVWAVNKISLNLQVTDTPIWYKTPKGPDVGVNLTYNSTDSVTLNNPFGNKWMFNYASYLVVDTGGEVTVFLPGGAKRIYNPTGGGNYAPSRANDHNKLTKISATRFELTYPEGDKAIYDIPSGTTSLQPFLIELKDRWGYSLTFGYDTNVRLTTITDAGGKVTALWYDTDSRVTKVWEPSGRHASFAYDSLDNLIEVVDMEGHAFQYTYDSDVRMTQLNTAQGPWNFTHEGPDADTRNANPYPLPGSPMWDNVRLIVTDPMGYKEEYFYDGYYGRSWHVNKNHYRSPNQNPNNGSFDVLKTVWDSIIIGNAAKVEWTGTGLLDGRANWINLPSYASGALDERFAYSPTTAMPTSVTNERGKVTTRTYNSAGNTTSVTDPRSYTTTYGYALNGVDLTSVTDAQSNVVASYTYDSKHQVTSSTNASGTTDTTYTAWGAPATLTRNSQTATYNYNSDGQLTSVTQGGATLMAFTYDAQNRVKTHTDASGLTKGFQYNNIDKVTRVTYPDSTDERIEYVCCGLPGAVKDRAGRWTYIDYDALKRKTRVQDASGLQTLYSYDAVGNMTKMVDSKGNETKWEYDGFGRATKKIYADNNYDAFTYSATGKLATRRDGKGQITSYSYDDDDNLTGINYPTSADTAFTYNSLNKIATMVDGLGTHTFGYDTMGRLTSIDGPWANDTVTYNYTALGQRDWLKINSTNTTSYTYDALERLDTVVSPAGTFNYDYVGATGKVDDLALPNGATANYTYDGLNQLTQVSNRTSASANISTYAYGYDARGVRTYMQQAIGSDPMRQVNFGYDATNQLASEISTETVPTTANSYSYDSMGNRSGVTDATLGRQTTYSNNALNQTTGMSQVDSGGTLTSSLTHDNNGSLTLASTAGMGSSTYAYDDANRLISFITRNSSNVLLHKSEFDYDGINRKRIRREYNWNGTAWVLLGEMRYVYDGMNVIQERDGSNIIWANYTRGKEIASGVGGLLAKSTSSTHLYYHYDGGGNVTQLTNSSGVTVAGYTYDAFGNELNVSGVEAANNTYRFSTKDIHLASGLYDYGFRFYSPGMGKWINRDPVQEMDGLNLYAFVLNNPINSVDAYGLKKEKCADELESMQDAYAAVNTAFILLLVVGGIALAAAIGSAGLAAAAELAGVLFLLHDFASKQIIYDREKKQYLECLKEPEETSCSVSDLFPRGKPA